MRLGFTAQTCTDLPCKWNDYFVKNLKGKRLCDINMFSEDVKVKLKCSIRKRKTMPEEASEEDKNLLLTQLTKCDTPPLCLSLFAETNTVFSQKQSPYKSRSPPQKLPQCLSTLYSPTPIGDLTKKIEEVFESMKLSETQQCLINEATKDQSKSIEWHSIRIGRITSSNVHQVLHTSSVHPCKSILNTICYPKLFTTDATKWGKDHEKEGLHEFRQVFSRYHSDIKIENCGLVLLKDASYIGASPDAIAICSCHGKSVVEVKCPFSYKHNPIEHYRIQSGHKYYSQIQLQMMATGVETGYFVVWTPEESFVQTIERDENYQSSMFLKCQSFWKDHILPELLTQKSLSLDTVKTSTPVLGSSSATISAASASATNTSSCTMFEASTSAVNIDCEQGDNLKTYCFCKGKGTGDMIGCDNPQCPYEWIHIACAKIKKVPKGKWYCKYCK